MMDSLTNVISLLAIVVWITFGLALSTSKDAPIYDMSEYCSKILHIPEEGKIFMYTTEQFMCPYVCKTILEAEENRVIELQVLNISMEKFGSVCQHELDVHLEVGSNDVINLPEQDAPVEDSNLQTIRLCGSQTPPPLWSDEKHVLLEVSCSAIWTKGSGFLIAFKQVRPDQIMSIVRENCTNHTNMFPCENGNCIPDTMVCNGVDNCKDGSDESFKMCEFSDRCTSSDWYCCAGGKEQIESSKLCDGYGDCEDDSDEDTFHAGCNKTNLPLCTRHAQFRCKSGACIDVQKLCSNITLCNDGSEENIDATEDIICSTTGCRPGYSACYDRTCIRSSSICDAIKDCLDGSDESIERCRAERVDNSLQFMIGLLVTGAGIILLCAILACCCKGVNCLKCRKTHAAEPIEMPERLPEEEIAATLPRLPRYDEPVSVQSMPPSYDNIAFDSDQTQSDTYTEIVLRVRTHSNGQDNSTDVDAVFRTQSGRLEAEVDHLPNDNRRLRNTPPPIYNRVDDDNVNGQISDNIKNEYLELPPPYQRNEASLEYIPMETITTETNLTQNIPHATYHSNQNDTASITEDQSETNQNNIAFASQTEVPRQQLLQSLNRPTPTIPLSRREDTIENEESYNDILENIGVDFTPEASSSPKPCNRILTNSSRNNDTSEGTPMQNETIEPREITITSYRDNTGVSDAYITLESSTVDDSNDNEHNASCSNQNQNITRKRQRSILKTKSTNREDRDPYYMDKPPAITEESRSPGDLDVHGLEVPVTYNSLQRHLSLDSPYNCFEVGRF